MKIEVILRSNVNNGKILIDGSVGPLSKNDYYHKFDLRKSQNTVITSFSDLPPGIKDGIEIVSFKADGRELLDIQHLNLEDFCVFHMKNNPYVSNETIAERNIVFNGDLVCSLNLEKILWFPFHYSDAPTGFIYSNNHAACDNDDGCYHGEPKEHRDFWSNLPFHGIDLTNSTKVALGCSVTYGNGVSKSYIWPTLLEYDNLGVTGAGVDAIYYNIKTLLEKGAVPEQVIIMFPNLERRLATFQKDYLYFRLPILPTQILPMDIMKKNYFWADQHRLASLGDATLREIVADTENLYSKGFMSKIAGLPISISVSSWSRETYEILPDYFERVLPFFEKLDDANDNPPHPGPTSHRKWAEKVQELL